MGKGRDKKKKLKSRSSNSTANSGKDASDDAFSLKKSKRSKLAQDSSDDEDIDAILESFRAQQAEKVKVSQEASGSGPSPRVNWSVQVNPITGEFLIYGGEHYDGKLTKFFNELYRGELKKEAVVWKRISSPNTPNPRSSHQAVITPTQQMFLFGGEFGTSKETKFFHYRDFWVLDLKTFTWEDLTGTMKPVPPPRSGHRMALWKHVIAMFGGFYDSGADTRYLDDLWLFDTKEYRWTKADWLNDPNTKPTARSGFQFISLESGIILYGGYCQVKGKQGAYEGQVLSDMWHLKIDLNDLKRSRWEKRKISNSAAAPMPRSGASSSPARNGKSLLLFGGVQDENLSEELLSGTCLNDLWEFNNEKCQWRQLRANATGKNDLIPRYNASMALTSNSSLLIMGGIYEKEDCQHVLDDCHSLNLDKPEKITCIRPLTVDLEAWQGSDESDFDSCSSDSELTETDDEDDSGAGSESEYSSDDEVADEDDPYKTAINTSHPQPFPGQSLKEYFHDHQDYWIDQARSLYPTTTNSKQVRGEAFQLAQHAFNEFDFLRLSLK